VILVLGSSLDRVYPTLIATLRQSGHPFVAVDEDHPEQYAVRRSRDDGAPLYRIEGNGSTGRHPVGAIFVRHAIVRSLDQTLVERLGALQLSLNRMLLAARCPVINHPSRAYSNYSKPFQVELLARAGFDVPRSLVTNIPAEARRFYDTCDGRVIVKGTSNVLTLAQQLGPEQLTRMELLPHCPTLFQEYVAGVDYRVHVIGNDAFVTRLVSDDEDYRRATLVDGETVVAEAASLPAPIIEKCIAFTKQLGLIVSGMDFKENASGRIVALECNPYPQFTFYEQRSGQPLTRAIVDYLIAHQSSDATVFA
jgi:glutathione synthase/RimK-type ligase-like ATP-grasp enzyme